MSEDNTNTASAGEGSSIKLPRASLPAVTFAGGFHRSSSAALTFTRHLETYFTQREVIGKPMTDREKIVEFSLRLTGEALNWFYFTRQGMREDVFSYDILLTKFAHTYHPKNYDEQIMDRIRKYKQGNQSTYYYLEKIRAMFYEMVNPHLFEKQVVQSVKSNLHRSICLALIHKEFPTLNELCSGVREVEDVLWDNGFLNDIKIKGVSKRHGYYNHNDAMDIDLFEGTRFGNANSYAGKSYGNHSNTLYKPKPKRSIRCYACKKIGHMKRECPNAKPKNH